MVSFKPRPQTQREEIANAVSHGIAFLLAVASVPILLDFASSRGNPADVVGVSVFAATMIVVYLVSALYHALPPGPTKDWFNRLDHAAIYLFIAGTYMPFALGLLRDAWDWTILLVICLAAALGMAAKLWGQLCHRLWSTGLYLAMGWVALVAALPLIERMGDTALAWLAGGCAAYTVGVVAYLFDDRVRYGHFVWHLFAMAGSGCHVVAVIGPATA